MDERTRRAAEAALKMVTALVETVEEAGERGAPSGALYLAFAKHGLDLANYQYLEGLALTTGRVEKRGDVLYRTDVRPSSTT